MYETSLDVLKHINNNRSRIQVSQDVIYKTVFALQIFYVESINIDSKTGSVSFLCTYHINPTVPFKMKLTLYPNNTFTLKDSIDGKTFNTLFENMATVMLNTILNKVRKQKDYSLINFISKNNIQPVPKKNLEGRYTYKDVIDFIKLSHIYTCIDDCLIFKIMSISNDSVTIYVNNTTDTLTINEFLYRILCWKVHIELNDIARLKLWSGFKK